MSQDNIFRELVTEIVNIDKYNLVKLRNLNPKQKIMTHQSNNKKADSEPTCSGIPKKQKVLKIAEISSIIGKVFVIGDNSVGQLGFNSDDVLEMKRPAVLEIPHLIVNIAAGGMHSVCLTQNGEVITFGCNDEGALGRETEDGQEYIPQKVHIPEKIVQISAGDSHTAALSENGQVYIWGNFRNNNGVMGLITPYRKEVLPVKILNNEKIVKISSGSDHLCCLSHKKIVYSCGNGETGQLGRVAAHANTNISGPRGINRLLSPQIVRLTHSRSANIMGVWTATSATFLKSRNVVYGFGLNNYGQLGIPYLLGENPDNRVIYKPKIISNFEEKNWKQINGGQHHTLALDNEGLVYSLGRSTYGMLGLGEDCKDVSQPTAIPSLAQKKCSGISCGNSESFALEDNGSVYSWGFGTNYQLGHGNDNDQYIPKVIEGEFGNSWKVLKVSGGGQHTLFLAHPRNSTEKTQ